MPRSTRAERELLRPVPESELNADRTGGKRLISRAVIALLILTGLGAGWYALPVVEGYLASSPISSDRTVALSENVRIVFAGDTYDRLLAKYYAEQEHEFAVCLLGDIDGQDYVVDEVYEARTFHQSVVNVISEQCPKGTIIPLHTHPYRQCLFSEQDLAAYNEFLQVNPNAIDGLMCAPERFAFYDGRLGK